MKTLALVLLLAACSSVGSSPSAPTGFACDEGHGCPDAQACMRVVDRYCCGGVACKADYYRCTSHDQCGADKKCDGETCVPCETVGCQEAIDGGVLPPLAIGPAAGCASGMGYEFLAGKSYGCPGKFAADTVRRQCAAGFDWCTSSTGARMASARTPHFFASAQPMEKKADTAQCGYTLPNAAEHYVAGVGGSEKAYIRPNPGICAGWPLLIRVDEGATSMSATLSAPPQETDLDHLKNDNPDDGIICCQGLQ